MRKLTLLISMLFLSVGMAWAQDYTPRETGVKAHATRLVGGISVGGDSYSLPSGTRYSYTDATEDKTFTIWAGETISLVMTQSGSWMNAFVYIDQDKNGFTAGIDTDGYTPTGDLVSYSFYNNGATSDASGYNSVGNSISGGNRSTLTLPNIVAPTTPGTYRIRFKYDWCNIDPAGGSGTYFGNTFTGHGGEIIDATLKVEDYPFEFVKSGKPTKWYNVALHPVQKNYISVNASGQATATTSLDGTLNSIWGFVGNPIDGFKLVNAAGKELVFGSPATVADENGTVFKVVKSSYGGSGFALQAPNSNQCLNPQSGLVKSWTLDQGCTVALQEAELPVAHINNVGYATLAAAYDAAVNGDVIVLNESVTTFPVIKKAVTFKGGKENAAVEINYALSQNFTAIDGIVRFENLTFNKPLFTEHGGNKPSLSIEFEGCNFNVNSEAGYGILIGTSWSNSVVKGLKVNNCNFKYVGTEFKGGYMLYVQCVNEVTITNNTIDGNNLYRGAIHLGDATEHATVATVSNNAIKNFCRGVMMGNRVVGSSATISGNTFDNINYSDKDSKPAHECAPIFIHSNATAEALQIALTNNEVENCANPMIYSEDTDLIKYYVTEFTGNTVAGAAVELANSYNAPNQIFPVATINDAEYFTLQAAIDAVQNSEEIVLQENCAEKVTFTQVADKSFVLNGNNKEFTGGITMTARAGKDAPSTLVIKNFNCKPTDGEDKFFVSTETNYYPNNVTIQDCTFEGSGADSNDVPVTIKSANNFVIKNCKANNVHSLLQNTAGWNITVSGCEVTNAGRGMALGSAQGVTIENVKIDASDEKYGIRVDAAYASTTTINNCEISAFIPVVARNASENYNFVFEGANTMTPANTDGLWCAISTEEYDENGEALPLPTGKVTVTLNGTGLSTEGLYGNYIAPVKIGETSYDSLADALAAANAMTGDVTVEVYGKVTLNSALAGNYSSIKFVGKEDDAEIYLDVQGYITATGKNVAFEDLTLSKSQGGFINNAGFMNVAFGIYDVAEVTYTNCEFANGAYAASGKVTYNGCTFKKSWEKYGLWAYGDVDVTVDGCKFDNDRGIKMYAEGAAKTTDLAVKNTDFSALTGKPAIVLTYGESVALEGNTYSETGTLELDLDGAPNGTAVTSDVTPVCKNDNGACGVLVDGKIYTTVAQAAEAATGSSTVTLLHNSTETVLLPEGSTLDRNGFTAPNVKVEQPLAGEGTEAAPYLINNVADLENFRNKVNAGRDFAGQFVKLAADIALTAEWAPIGNGTRSSKSYSGNAFKGTFDGDNKTISGLKITSTTGDDAAIGLFGVVDGGTVKNLTLYGVNIDVANSDLAGGAIGLMLNGATADNITVNGAIVGNDGVGGIVGRLVINGTIENCTNNASVTSSYGGIGGIVGKAYYEDGANTALFASIENCTNNGTVTAPMYVGGIVGLARANVTGCVNNGAVVGGTQTGGIIGQLIAAGTVSGNENKAKITGKNHLGGIIGDYSQSSAYTYYNVAITSNINRGELAATEQCAAIMGCNNIDGFTAMTATGNLSYYFVEGLELFGNPEDMVIDATNKFVLPIAKIGDNIYYTLAEAAADAKAGDEIVLLADVEEAGEVTLPEGVKLNGNGKKLTNSGKINLTGVELVNATIDGTGTTYFYNTINFNGANSITSGVNGSPFELVVNKGANLLISRFVLGYGRNITVYGEIEDAHAFDPTGKTPSLKFNSTSGVSVGGTGTGNITAKDAYIEFGNSSWKNSQAVHTWSFENCYISATSLGNNNAPASEDAKWDVTFNNSVVAAKNYIKNGKNTTYSFTNGSVGTTGSLRIDGELNIDATSSVTTTAQQNNKVGEIDEHGGINGTVNVAGTLTIGSTSNTQLEVLGGTVNVEEGATVALGSNTLTLDATSAMKSAGNINGAITAAEGASVAISGGSYTQDVTDWCTDGFMVKPNADGTFGVVAKPVAKVGNTEYSSIDEAIANWTHNTTLTLLADVTLSDVVRIKSTEYHILDLGTYTMTAATGKNAIEITNEGRSSASYALDIKADATNPGGITASRAVVKTTGKSGVKDRPIIRFYNGVFNASNIIQHSGSNGTNSPQFVFYNGVYNGNISTNRAICIFEGGTFNGRFLMSVDSSSYARIGGGTFKYMDNLNGSALNANKFTIGSAKGVFDRGVYVDDNGNVVVGGTVVTEAGDKFEASSANATGAGSYLQYSSAQDNGLYYTAVEEALADNNKASGSVTVYVEELDMAGIDYKGTIVVPDGGSMTVTNVPATTTIQLSAGASVVAPEGTKVVATDGNIVVENNGKYESRVAVAKIGEQGYESLEAALKAAVANDEVTILSDIAISGKWDCRNVKTTVPVTINGNDKTIKFTAELADGYNHIAAFRFEAPVVVKDLTLDLSEATTNWAPRMSAISTKAGITVDGCTFIGNPEYTNSRAIIFGEGSNNEGLAGVEVSVTNSKFTNWRYGVSDNQNANDVNKVAITGSEFTNANVNVSAKGNVTFTGNTLEAAYVAITSYTAADSYTVAATDNTFGTAGTKPNSIVANPANVTAQDAFALPVAKVGEGYHLTLQAALAAATEGSTVALLAGAEIEEGTVELPWTLKNVTIQGAEGAVVKNTVVTVPSLGTTSGAAIDYDGVTFNGVVFDNSRIYLPGWANDALNQSVSVKNLAVTGCTFQNIVTTDNIAAVNLNMAESELVENFTFTGNTISSITGGESSGVIALVKGNVAITGNTIKNVSGNAINVQFAGANVEITGNTLENWGTSGAGRAIRSVVIDAANSSMTVAQNVMIHENAPEEFAKVTGSDVKKVVNLNGNYWSGKNPLDSGVLNVAGETVDNYYADAELTTLMYNRMGGSIVGYTDENRIWGESWGNAYESYVVKAVDANGNVMGTATLKNYEGIIDGDVTATWSINFAGTDNNFWDVEWTTAPTVDNMPAKVQLWIDGAQVSEGPVQLNAPDNLKKIVAVVTGADGAIISCRTSFEAAVAAAKKGDIVELLDNVTISEQVTVADAEVLSGITINGNGKTITAKLDESKSPLYFGNPSTGAWATGVAINDLTIKTAEGTKARFGIFLGGGTSSKLTNVKIEGDYEYYGVNLYGTHGAEMTGCDIVSLFTNGQDDNKLNLVDTHIGHLYANKSDLAVDGAKVFADDATVIDELTFWGESTIMIAPDAIDNIAKINGTIIAEAAGVYYTTLPAAVAAAADGATVKLLADVTMDTKRVVELGTGFVTLVNVQGKAVTIDLNGKTVTVDAAAADLADYGLLFAVFHVDTDGNLTITDSSNGAGAVNLNVNDAVVYSFFACTTLDFDKTHSGRMTIEGGNYRTAGKLNNSMLYADADEVMTINGGNFHLDGVSTTASAPSMINTGGVNTLQTVVNGGTFNVDVLRQYRPFEVKIAETLAVNNNGDGTWSVVPAEAYVIEKFGEIITQAGDTEVKVGYARLADAVAAVAEGETVTMVNDVTYTKETGFVNGTWVDGLVYDGDKNFTVDFAGHTITDNGEINDYLVYLKNTGAKDNEITFKNGKVVVGSTTAAYAAITVGSNSSTHKTTLNLDAMEVVNGNPNATDNQVIRIRNGATANLNDGTLVTSNGTSYGVVAEAASVVNINSGAKVVHTNSGTTDGNLVYTAVSGNGTINIYNGAVIESDKYGIHNMTSGNAVINIYGGTITAQVAVHVATNGGAGETATVNITGGTINGVMEEANSASSIIVSGGIFDRPVGEEFCAVDYAPVAFEDGTYGVECLIVDEYVIVDDGSFAYKEVNTKSVGTLRYERRFVNAGAWQTFYVPFEIPVQTLLDLGYEVAYFYDVHFETNDEGAIDPESIPSLHVMKITSGTMKANYPYAIKPTTEDACTLELELEDVTLYPASKGTVVESSTTVTRFEFGGLYTRTICSDYAGDGVPCYTLVSSGSFKKVASTTNLTSFRVYMTIKSKDGSPVINAPEYVSMRVIGEEREDGTTTIYDVFYNETVGDDMIYDLQGRRILEPQKGEMYIINGKKVIY